jgi:hypothetical protein
VTGPLVGKVEVRLKDIVPVINPTVYSILCVSGDEHVRADSRMGFQGLLLGRDIKIAQVDGVRQAPGLDVVLQLGRQI